MKVLHNGGRGPSNTFARTSSTRAARPCSTSRPGRSSATRSSPATSRRRRPAPDYAAIGRFRLINDTLVAPVVAAVVDGTRPVGYVVRWRRITAASKETRDQLSTLLGGNAQLYFGNDRGDVWTDLVDGRARAAGDGASCSRDRSANTRGPAARRCSRRRTRSRTRRGACSSNFPSRRSWRRQTRSCGGRCSSACSCCSSAR